MPAPRWQALGAALRRGRARSAARRRHDNGREVKVICEWSRRGSTQPHGAHASGDAVHARLPALRDRVRARRGRDGALGDRPAPAVPAGSDMLIALGDPYDPFLADACWRLTAPAAPRPASRALYVKALLHWAAWRAPRYGQRLTLAAQCATEAPWPTARCAPGRRPRPGRAQRGQPPEHPPELVRLAGGAGAHRSRAGGPRGAGLRAHPPREGRRWRRHGQAPGSLEEGQRLANWMPAWPRAGEGLGEAAPDRVRAGCSHEVAAAECRHPDREPRGSSNPRDLGRLVVQ